MMSSDRIEDGRPACRQENCSQRDKAEPNDDRHVGARIGRRDAIQQAREIAGQNQCSGYSREGAERDHYRAFFHH